MSRPTVSVFSAENEKEVTTTIPLPTVFTGPIRADVVAGVHRDMNKNRKQAYAVKFQAGHQCSAECWGTGRAVARIPRCQGGGTSRSGQGAFGNMCRGGRMFGATKIWRKWHHKISKGQRRFATVSALAASALPALVAARGHTIDNVPEFPLVVGNGAESIQKTSDANAFLARFGADDDVTRCAESKQIRAGRGKMRDRRYVIKKGPLIVFNEDNGVKVAFRNLPGVDVCHVDRLNLLQLAPGGHLGRFCIWTQGAFAKLEAIFSAEGKTGFNFPSSGMVNPDIARIINSDEVQSVVRPAMKAFNGITKKVNPYNNAEVMKALNPYAATAAAAATKLQATRTGKKAELLKAKRAARGKFKDAAIAFYEAAQGDLTSIEQAEKDAEEESEDEEEE